MRKNCCFCCLVFVYFCFVSWFLLVLCFYVAKFLFKKFEFVLIATFIILLMCSPLKPSYGELFSTNLVPIFFYPIPSGHQTSFGRLYEVWTSYRRPLDVQRTSDTHWVYLSLIVCTYFYLWEPLFIYQNLFSSVRISFYLSESIFIYVHLILSVRISSFSWSSLRIYSYLWSSARIYFLKFLWKKASVWTPSSKTNLLSSKHDDSILLISYVPILCFFALNSSHFVLCNLFV